VSKIARTGSSVCVNVELFRSIKSFKYVCKKKNKGSDQAAVMLERDKNEVTPKTVAPIVLMLE